MPKVKGPLFSVDAKGTLADAISYQGGLRGHRVTKVPSHKDTFSAPQLIERMLFLEGRDYWASLSAGEKETFNEDGAKLGMTGYNYAIKEFKKGRLQGDLRLFAPMQEGEGAVVADRSGYGNDGAITGALWVQLASGLWVLDFSGAGDYVNVGDGVGLVYTSGDPRSHFVWMKTTPTLESGDLLGVATGAMIRMFTDGGSLAVQFNGSGNSGSGLVADKWHHVGFTYDGSTLTLYINGVAVFSGSPSGGDPANYSADWHVGKAGYGEWMSLLGMPRIYRACKSGAWVREHYCLCKAFFS